MDKGAMKNPVWIIILVVILLAITPFVYAFACFCDGYVFNSDASAVNAGTLVNVTNLNTLELEITNTSYDYPPIPAFNNRYKTAFECTPGVDQIRVFVTNGTHFGQEILTVPGNSQAYSNITLNQLFGVFINSTPSYRHVKKNETTTYTLTILNAQAGADDFTLTMKSGASYAHLDNPTITNLASGATVTRTLTVNDTDSGSYYTEINVTSDIFSNIHSSITILTEVNYPPTIASPADTPDPVQRGNNIKLSATGTDLDGALDQSKLIACTNNSVPINGQCAGGSAICDFFDAPETGSATGVTVLCYHNVTELNQTTVTYYLAAVDTLNETSAFTSAQTYYVGTPPTTPPSGGGGGGSVTPPEPEPEPTCSDGIKNQGEENVDCGGPCSPCISCHDGIWNQGEFSIDCGGPCPPCETCYDGIKNQDETGTDCGGKCPECETCSDGIQNQGETGTDCGGPCLPCATCSDGILNQGEEETDCGGPCLPCPPPETCDDGIQNNGEEKTDCGGPCPPCEEKLLPIEEEPKRATNDVESETVMRCNSDTEITEQEIGDIHNYQVYGLDEQNIALPINIPKDYVLAVKPFKTDCSKESFNISVAVPDDLEEVKVLRCRGGNCRTVKLREGDDPCAFMLGVEKQPREEKIIPADIERIDVQLQGKKENVKTKTYQAEFGEEVKGVNISIQSPDEILEYPANKNLRIVGNPVMLNISRGNDSQGEIVTVSIPFRSLAGDDPESVSLYARKIEDNKTRWIFVGGKVDLVKNIIQKDINLTKFEQNGKVILAPITISCQDCETTGFRNAYTPEPDTKNAVILIHGMFGTSRVWENFIRTYRLTNQPYQLWTFSYLVSKPVQESAIELANYLETNRFRYNRIEVIGYSLGGLVTQTALRYAYEENQKNANRYTFIKKVDKALLIATPNDGSPVAERFEDYITGYINEEATDYLPLNPLTLEALKNGIHTEQVPGIEYFAIAGTKPYQFMNKIGMTKELFGDEPNDGLVAVSSAEHIGNTILNQECVNFWTRPLEHTQLITEKNTQNLISQIINSKIKDALDELGKKGSLAGYSKYFDLTIDKCNPEDLYVIIGKPGKQEQEELLCGCGDGVCAGFENEGNCPEDCKNFPVPALISIIMSTIIILFIPYFYFRDYLILFVRKIRKGIEKGKSNKEIKQELLEFGYHGDILYLVEKIAKLKSVSNYRIRDMMAKELPRNIRWKFNGLVIIKNWVKYHVVIKGRPDVEQIETMEAKRKKEERKEKKEKRKKEKQKAYEAMTEEELLEEAAVAIRAEYEMEETMAKNAEKAISESKEKEEDMYKDAQEALKKKGKKAEKKEDKKKKDEKPKQPKKTQSKPKKKTIKKAIKKAVGMKDPEDILKELEKVDEKLTEAKKNEELSFEALF